MRNKTKFKKCIQKVASEYPDYTVKTRKFCTLVALEAYDKYDLNCNADQSIQSDFINAIDEYFGIKEVSR